MNRPHSHRGGIAIEFALLVIPLLVVLTGITEFGRALYYYNIIAKGARDAARLMSTQTPSDLDYAALTTQAKCTAVYGNTACAGEPLIPGLATTMVSICDPVSCAATHAAVATGSGVANLVTVTIGGPNNPYVFQSVAPFMPALFGIPDISFGAVNVTMRQII
jgi:Flp pilus assembly protein TadG